MYAAMIKWLGRSMGRSSTICRRPEMKRDAVLERLEERVALSGALNGDVSSSHRSDPSHGLAKNVSSAVHSVSGPDAKEPDAGAVNLPNCSLCAAPLSYNATLNVTISPMPGVFAYVTPAGAPGLTAWFSNTTTRGVLQYNYPSTNGLFSYTATTTGVDQFTYYVTSSNGQTSNTATITITNTAQAGLVPSTPYYNYLRARRSIDPARFDFYHPRIGALLGMEITGIPASDTTIVSVNKHFNVAAARSAHAENPGQYDQEQPILGALFQLEKPTGGDPSLLPDTAYYNGQRSLYDADPTGYQERHVYLAAIFAIENFAQTGSTVVPPAAAGGG